MQQPKQSSFTKGTDKNWRTTKYYEKGINFDKCKESEKQKPSNERVHMAMVVVQRLSVLSNFAAKANSMLVLMTLGFNRFHLHTVSGKNCPNVSLLRVFYYGVLMLMTSWAQL